jgi:hypothetical protein
LPPVLSKVGVDGDEIGWFEHFREIITRGSLRGKWR